MRNRILNSTVLLLLAGTAFCSLGCESDQGITCATGLSDSEDRTADRTPKHQYYYYPTTQVYRDCEANRWYWPTNGTWEHGENLPTTVSLGSEIPFALELVGDDPTVQHASIAREYPAPRTRDSVNAAAPTE
jgi:hypothetical protein